jgi:MFS transporter, NNP family, nitrate/nitrite transporter
VLTDPRVWLLALAYAASFGIELTMDSIAALYFADYFNLGVVTAGLVAGLFGLMNIFARSLGGMISDRFHKTRGLRGRVLFLSVALLAEGLGLILFSRVGILALAIPILLLFGLAVKMSNGANYGIVPFVNRPALGMVAGIVGAGGNLGAVLAGFLFRGGLAWNTAFLILGCGVAMIALTVPLVRFTTEQESAVKSETIDLLALEAAASD